MYFTLVLLSSLVFSGESKAEIISGYVGASNRAQFGPLPIDLIDKVKSMHVLAALAPDSESDLQEDTSQRDERRHLSSLGVFTARVWSTASICAVLLVLFSIIDVWNRMRLGVKPTELTRNGCREISGIHQMISAARLPLGLFGVGLGIMGLGVGFQFLEHLFSKEWSASGGRFAIMCILLVGTWFVWKALIFLSESVEGGRTQHGTDTTILNAAEGIDENEVRNLGRERFPEGAAFDLKTMQVPRQQAFWFATVVSIAIASFEVVVLLSDQGGSFESISARLTGTSLKWSQFLDAWTPWGEFVGIVAYAQTVCLYLFNRKYLILSPKRHWILFLCSALAASFFMPAWYPSFHFAWGIVMSIGIMCCLRIRSELKELRTVARRECRFAPLRKAMEIGGHNLLDRVQNGGFFRFPSLDLTALDAVIDKATKQVERNEYLCPPRFSRYMRDAAVRWLRMVILEFRQMTVRRDVVFRNERPTSEALRHPKVPVWDEGLFPIIVPDGYVSRVDEKLLGPEWIVVQTCGSCHGTGKVSCGSCGGKGYNDRSSSSTQNGRTVTTHYRETCSMCHGTGRVTCSRCRGRGRLMWDQALQTIWEREVVNVSEPFVLNDDFLDGAMVDVFWQKDLMENRKEIESTDTTPVEIDEADLLHLGNLMKDAIDHADKQTSATLYRMDLRLGGCLIHKILFPMLPGVEGWVFGGRDSLFSPRLPFSFQRLAVFSLLPPLVAAASIATIFLLFRLADWVALM